MFVYLNQFLEGLTQETDAPPTETTIDQDQEAVPAAEAILLVTRVASDVERLATSKETALKAADQATEDHLLPTGVVLVETTEEGKREDTLAQEAPATTTREEDHTLATETTPPTLRDEDHSNHYDVILNEIV